MKFKSPIRLDFLSITALVLIIIFLLAAVAAPLLYPDIYEHINGTKAYNREGYNFVQPELPSLSHPFGMNRMGLDILELVVWGLRPLIVIGLVAGVICVIAGVFVGTMAGYFDNFISDVISRSFDILLPFSSLAMLVFIVFVVGSLNMTGIILVFSMTFWVRVARVIRAEVIKMKEQPFITGAKAIGAYQVHIIYKYIFRNMGSTLVNMFFHTFSEIIFVSAALSFLGINYFTTLAPYDLGRLVAMGYATLSVYWWESIFPGLILLLFILSFNILGNYLDFNEKYRVY
ncbi:MAG: ABC transporter permease [Halanaerobium sp.]|nr:ABC transporter permease [Halanaerobium sp.]